MHGERIVPSARDHELQTLTLCSLLLFPSLDVDFAAAQLFRAGTSALQAAGMIAAGRVPVADFRRSTRVCNRHQDLLSLRRRYTRSHQLMMHSRIP